MPELAPAPDFISASDPPAPPAAGETHLWRIPIKGPLPSTALLSVDEQRQHLSFHRAEDRDRYRISHVALRRILGGYLGIEGIEIEFTTGPWGKPALAPGAAGLEFNLSHSGACALVAVRQGAPVGVDLEIHRNDLDPAELAGRILAPDDLSTFTSLNAREARNYFYHAWTHKEAVLKALGTGLSIEPTCVSLEGGQAEVHSHGESISLFVKPINLGDGYSAAIASPLPFTQLSLFDHGG